MESEKKLTPEDVELLKKANPNTDVADDIFFIIEMNQETGQQNLVAAPNLHCPVFGGPVIVPITEALPDDDVARTMREAAEYVAARGGHVFYSDVEGDDLITAWQYNGDDDNGDEWREMQVARFDDVKDLDSGDPPEQYVWLQAMENDGTPIFRQARDEEGNRLYMWHAVAFTSEELAKSWVKERGVQNHVYMIMQCIATANGENTMEHIMAIQEEEAQNS